MMDFFVTGRNDEEQIKLLLTKYLAKIIFLGINEKKSKISKIVIDDNVKVHQKLLAKINERVIRVTENLVISEQL